MNSAGALLGSIVNKTDSPETYWQLLMLMEDDFASVAEALNLREPASARAIIDACDRQAGPGAALLNGWFAHIDAVEGNSLRRCICEKIEARATAQLQVWQNRKEELSPRLQQAAELQSKLMQVQRETAQLEVEYAAVLELETQIKTLQHKQQALQAEIGRIRAVDIVALEDNVAGLAAQKAESAQQVETLQAQCSRMREEIKQLAQERQKLESQVAAQLKADFAALQKWIGERQKYLETARDRGGRLGDLELPPNLMHLTTEIEELQKLLGDGEGGINKRINHVYREWRNSMRSNVSSSGPA